VVFDLTGNVEIPIPWTGFCNDYPFNRPVYAVDGAGKTKKLSLAEYWLQSPQCINLDQVVHDPRKGRLYDSTSKQGKKTLNLFKPQLWTLDAYDISKVQPFLDFVDYLFPEQEEREYILDMLTSKLNDLTFRGTAIVMFTQTQGTGRTTFTKIIGQLMGTHNVADLTIEAMFDGAFNDWQQSLVLFVNEAKTTHKQYEKFKQFIDTTGRELRVNPKYMPERQVYCCAMTFISTNNPDGVTFNEQDRRFTPVRNPERPQSPTYYDQLNDWLIHVDWQEHVACYLKQRTLTGVNLTLPLETATRQVMLENTVSALTRALMALREHMNTSQLGYITTTNMKNVVIEAMRQTGEEVPHPAHLNKALNDISTALKIKTRSAKSGKAERCRIMLQGRAGPSEWATHYQMGDATRDANDLSHDFKREVVDQIDALDYVTALATVVDAIK
jgi:hypothetical protein